MTDDDEKTTPKSAATVLVDLALEHYSLHSTDAGEAFAVPHRGANHIARKLRGGRLSLASELSSLYFTEHGRAVAKQAVSDALATLEGMAQDRDPEELHLRVAEAHGAVWIDTGDSAGHVLKLAGGGWRLVEHAPVLFHRTALTAPMPHPEDGGTLDELREFVNITDDDWPLLVAVLVAAWLPGIPHPIPTMTGEQGTGKSTTTRMLVDLIDPSAVPLRKPPREPDGWVTAASGSWVVAVDNLSTVPDWFSDSLCRAVTGDGDVRRQLYSDAGLAVFKFRRQVILTGIDFAGLRGDLAERLVMLELRRIGDLHRREERDLDAAWAAARPRILGALLEVAASTYLALPSVALDRKPRMADFAKVLAAVDGVLGTKGLDRYARQAREVAADTLASSSFAAAILDLILPFEGTAAELLSDLTSTEPGWKPPRDWPKNARAVTTILRKDAPALRKQGWTVDDLGASNHANATIWRIEPAPVRVGIGASRNSPTSPSAPVREFARHASHENSPGEVPPPADQDDRACQVCGGPLWSAASRASGICARTDPAHHAAHSTASEPVPAQPDELDDAHIWMQAGQGTGGNGWGFLP